MLIGEKIDAQNINIPKLTLFLSKQDPKLGDNLELGLIYI